MSSDTSGSPPPAGEGIETELQCLSIGPTRQESQQDADVGSCSNSNTGQEIEESSHADRNTATGIQMAVNGSVDRKKSGLSADVLSSMADILEESFVRRPTARCIQSVIAYRGGALLLTPDGHAARQYRLATFGDSLYRRFKVLGGLEYIDKAIQYQSQALLLAPDGPLSEQSLLNNLATSYMARFESLEEPADIDEAIRYLNQALLLTPDGHALKPSVHNNLGSSYRSRFERQGNLADIEKAIECLSKAVLLAPEGHPDAPARLSNLGISYQSRFNRLGQLSDIDKAIEYKSQAVLLTPDGHANKPNAHNNLGSTYLARFKCLGDLADIEKAIECFSQAVSLTPNGHPAEPERLSNLGTSYRRRFASYGNLDDIDKAIEHLSQAVLLTPNGRSVKPTMHTNLGNSYRSRFERLGNLADMDKAIELLSEAVLLTPAGHPDQPNQLTSLGGSHRSRFERLGELEDIDRAIEYLSQAVLLSPDGHAGKPNLYNNLGNSYMSRFICLGELADIDKAIECLSQAVLLSPDGHADKPSRLSNLGNSYQFRFDRLGELEDINRAIEYSNQAVLLDSHSHVNKQRWLDGLGSSYTARFERFGGISDIEKAIECRSQVVMHIPNDHAEKSGALSGLGTTYYRRFERLGDLADIDKAIECFSQALPLSPDDHPKKPAIQNNHGNAYRLRFERLGEPSDIDKAIEGLSQAVLLTPDGHAKKPARFKNLGASLIRRFESFGDLADIKRAQSYFQSGAQLPITHPDAQIACARMWAITSKWLDLSPQPAYERCMELIPHLIWLGATINRRYTDLSSISDFATEAAAWAISVQSYDVAIEWLEQGRSIVWNQVLQLRTPFDDLSAVDPALADRLKSIAAQLEASGSRQAATDSAIDLLSDLEQDAQHHRRLATKWEELLKDVRCIPGFHNFMRPRKADELKLAATDGPVVLINTHSTRCDALMILPQCDDIVHLGLDSASLKKLVKAREQLDSWARQQGARGRGFQKSKPAPKVEESFKPIMATLWSDVVKPVLDSIACARQRSDDELPHVTWCTTGVLSFLPLHAAGLYNDSQPNAFDLVVSSYTPTLSALLAAKASDSNAGFGVLGVGQENAPGLPSLPSTVHELAAVKKIAKATHFQQLDGESASVEAVLSAMKKHSWVHLACHASQNPTNPADSAFHLCDGPLTLQVITKTAFNNKGLAFLSACQTATGDDKIPDESVHLAAGMLMAGYPSVIGTMWSIYDEDAPGVAGEVYAELLKDGKMDHRGSARALHKAVASLRPKVGNDGFKRWVPFIHIGV